MPVSRSAVDVENEILSRYQQRTPASRAQHKSARLAMPGGDTRSSTYYDPYPTYMVSGDGAWMRDCDGNRYLDMLNNYTSLVHGHAQPAIVEEAADQLTRGTVFGAASPAQGKYAAMLVDRLPGMDLLRFANSGTEATMMMLRAARAYTGRDLIIKIDGGYHGAHDFVEVNIHADAEATGMPRAHLEGKGVPATVLDAALVAPFNDLDAMESLLSDHAGQVAAIIVEPMANSGGMIPPAPGYLRGLRQLADAYDALLLFDEVVTFRLSRGGMQEIAGVVPDMTALAKIIGGGFPIGAFGGKRELMEQFDPAGDGEFLQHSGTFNGNSITMVAGMTALRRLDQAAINRINALGEKLAAGVNGIFNSAGIRAQCLGYGSLQQIQWTDAPLVTLADAARAGQNLGKLGQLFHLEMLNRGLYTSNRAMFCISTPMTDAEVDTALEAIEGAVGTVKPYMRQAAPHLLREAAVVS